MKIITKYEEIDKTQWGELIQTSRTATWFQTAEAYEFYASLPELFMPFAVAVENETLRGIIVGYVTKEKNALKQFATRRAIIIGGPLLADDIQVEELRALLMATTDLVGKQAIYIETRNFNDYSTWRPVFEQCGWKYEEHLNFQVDCQNLEQVHASMSESRLRQIKKASKNGVIIEEAKTIDEVHEYFTILQHLYKTKVKTPLFPFEFFKTFYEKGYGKYLLVKNEKEILGGIMCPILDNRIIYEWFVCGKDQEYKALYPSVMATYAAIKYATDNHIAMFDFMGAGTSKEAYGVRDFKARFGGKEVEHGRFIKLCEPILYIIGKIGVKILKKL